jgi:hypothetical protein
MEALGLRPVNLAEKAAPEKRSTLPKTAPAGGLENLGKISFKFGPKSFRQGTGKFHAAAVQPAGGGRAVEPRAGDSLQGSLQSRWRRRSGRNSRPGRGRHVAGRRDGEIAG